MQKVIFVEWCLSIIYVGVVLYSPNAWKFWSNLVVYVGKVWPYVRTFFHFLWVQNLEVVAVRKKQYFILRSFSSPNLTFNLSGCCSFEARFEVGVLNDFLEESFCWRLAQCGSSRCENKITIFSQSNFNDFGQILLKCLSTLNMLVRLLIYLM